jgi:hypothetical protein
MRLESSIQFSSTFKKRLAILQDLISPMAGTDLLSGKCYERSSKAFKRFQGGKPYLKFALDFL